MDEFIPQKDPKARFPSEGLRIGEGDFRLFSPSLRRKKKHVVK
jgi:hypothetical protein